MILQNYKHYFLLIFMATSLLILHNPSKINAASCPSNSSEFFSSPSYVSAKVTPNVLIILDNSASMNSFAYPAGTAFDPGREYYGLFDPDKCYQYDNTSHYFEYSGDPTYDDPATTTIFERSTGTNTGARLFSGNWLNWWTMRRIDVAKKVLTGGKIAPDTINTVLEGSPMDRDTTKTFDDAGPLFYTPFRQAIYSFFFNTDRGDTLGGAAQDQFTAMFSVLDTNAGGADLTTPVVPADNGNNTGEATIPYNGLNYDGYVVAVKVEATDLPVSGIIQKMKNYVRFGYMNFHAGNGPGEGWAVNQNIFNWDIDRDGAADVRRFSADGGRIRDYIGTLNTTTDPHGDTVSQITQNVNQQIAYSNTPLSETLWEAVKYFKQDSPAFTAPANDCYNPPNNIVNFEESDEWDPYFFNNMGTAGEFVRCAKSFIIYLSDGAATTDNGVSTANWPNGGTAGFTSNLTGILDDIAYNMHTQDLRDDTAMGYATESVDQTIKLYTVFCFDTSANAKAQLMAAARAGGFDDNDNDGNPGGTTSTNPAAFVGDPKWDADGDNIPDTFYEAQDGSVLEKALLETLASITSDATSGTAAAVSSRAKGAEGLIFRAFFYPSSSSDDFFTNTPINWFGNVTGLFMDKYGLQHEDTNRNMMMDIDTDYVIKFSTGGDMLKYAFDSGTKTFTQIFAIAGDGNTTDGDLNDNGIFEIDEIAYPFDALSWFDTPGMDFTTQRDYKKNDNKRYIFTDKIDTTQAVSKANLDSTMQIDFVDTADFVNDSTNDNYFFLDPYIEYDHDGNSATPNIGYTEQDMIDESKNIVNFIRGEELLQQTQTAIAYRDRTLDFSATSSSFKALGDIISSTPTIVSKTAEHFDLLYQDHSYREFKKQYLKRRTVVYAGANDGMLHAFNAGFYDATDHSINKSPTVFDTVTASDVPAIWNATTAKWEKDSDPTDNNYKYEIGAELWAYVPNALLPQLKWLKDNLSGDDHIYYVDLKPRIFDGKIFTPDEDHPNGWGTILIGGMGLGGGTTQVDTTIDTNPASPNFGNPDPDGNCEMEFTSTYFAIDITNPELPPKLLWSFTDPDLGFTTSYPTAMHIKNDWYIVLGSGPNNYTAMNNPTVPVVYGGKNNTGYVYVLNAKTGVLEKKFSMDNTSFMQSPVAVDYDWKTTIEGGTGTVLSTVDGIYIASDGADTGEPGKVFRFITNGDATDGHPDNWTQTTFFDPNPTNTDKQHITTSLSLGIDDQNNFWVYFGTGRFWGSFDKQTPYFEYQNSFYGIKEPSTLNPDGSRTLTFATEFKSNLKDTTNIWVEDDKSVPAGLVNDVDSDGDVDFEDLVKDIEDNFSGWTIDFSIEGERNLSQAALIGGMSIFTTYIPTNDICETSGESYLYALYYKTGTAYHKGFLLTDATGLTGLGGIDNTNGTGSNKVINKTALGSGLASTPNIVIIPPEKQGGKTSTKIVTGKDKSTETGEPPEEVTTHKTSWRELETF